MHHTSEKKKRRSKNPQVSVRLNVRPLRENWKPVKRYECDDGPLRTKETPSPAEDQLDATVWKTKNVRTDIVKAIAVVTKEEKSNEENKESPKRVPGLVGRCDCASCERADETPTALELSPRETRDDLYLENKKRLREKKRKNRSKSSNKGRRHGHRESSSVKRSLSTPPPAPPNSVVSRENQQHWCKLYEDTHHPTKPIDFKKIQTVPGQIGMSELEPEEPATPPPTSNDPEDVLPHRSPNLQIMRPPPVSPPSNVSEHIYNLPPPTHHQPSLVPQLPTKPPENIVILPAPVDNSSNLSIIKENAIKDVRPDTYVPPGTVSDSNSSLVFMHSSTIAPGPEVALPSTSNVSMIRKMERLFYSSESNWWILVALIMLTIFAYRSSIEQHTCYYD